MKYSDAHVQHLLSHIDGYARRNCLNTDAVDEILGQMRGSLRRGHHAKYRKLARDNDIRLCDLCHAAISRSHAKLCDACWELDQRLERSRFLFWATTPGGRAALKEAEDDIHNALVGVL